MNAGSALPSALPLALLVLLAGCLEGSAGPTLQPPSDEPMVTEISLDACGMYALVMPTPFTEIDPLLPLGIFPRDIGTFIQREAAVSTGFGSIGPIVLDCPESSLGGSAGIAALGVLISRPAVLPELGDVSTDLFLPYGASTVPEIEAIIAAHGIRHGAAENTTVVRLAGEQLPPPTPPRPIGEVMVAQATVELLDGTISSSGLGGPAFPPRDPGPDGTVLRIWSPLPGAMAVIDARATVPGVLGPAECDITGDSPFTELMPRTQCRDGDMMTAYFGMDIQFTATIYAGVTL